jgi:hypothetical protein
MRPARTTPAAGRDALRERQRRGRTGALAMRERYPQLTALQVDFDFSDRAEYLPSPQVTVFHPPAPAYFRFACPYNDCDGEFDLTKAVDLAVSSRDGQARGQVHCGGTRHRGVACTLCLEYTISPRWPQDRG